MPNVGRLSLNYAADTKGNPALDKQLHTYALQCVQSGFDYFTSNFASDPMARNRGQSAELTAGACLLPFALLSRRSAGCYLSIIICHVMTYCSLKRSCFYKELDNFSTADLRNCLTNCINICPSRKIFRLFFFLFQNISAKSLIFETLATASQWYTHYKARLPFCL